MTDDWTASGGRPSGVATPSGLPTAAWALAWSCLIGQLLLLGDRGLARSDSAWVILSMLLGALLVGWVSTGVLTVAHLVASLAQVIALASFSATEYFAWQRSRPRAQGPALGSVLVIAVIVGILGGITPVGSGAPGVQVRVGEHAGR